ncbi:MAG: hypothetical protein ACYDBH_01710 [Acidobacteriaceae bacterium]
MNIAMQIGEHFNRVLRSYEHRAEIAHEDYEAQLDWIGERAEQIIDQMIATRTPEALEVLRDRLERVELDGLTYDLLHALLWQPDAQDTKQRTDALKAKLIELARNSYTLTSVAEAQAQREWETRHDCDL